MFPALTEAFFERARVAPDRVALRIDGAETTYAELAREAARIAAWLASPPQKDQPRVGILARRSVRAYAAILGACRAGAPSSPSTPKRRPPASGTSSSGPGSGR